ncbi:Uncharacterised protein [uncultured archaeon]|nr:Uncharacterised protein [uncultured archaeon]
MFMATGNYIIIPKMNVNTYGEPVIFLAGPVNRGNGWQNRAIEIIKSQNPRIYIAVPDYSGMLDEKWTKWSERQGCLFDSQLEWEQYYLEIAEKNGAILFWLPKQDGEMPISRESGFTQPYAQDTRPETGAWGWGNLRHNPKAHVAVGGEEGYSGLRTTRRNFAKYASHIPFRDKLEQVCDDALGFIPKGFGHVSLD